jgi:hypothetical protein
VSFFLAAIAVVLCLVSLGRREGGVVGSVLVVILGIVVGGFDLLVTVVAGAGAPGRPLRVAGIRRLPRVRRGPTRRAKGREEGEPDVSRISIETRRSLGAQWLEDARAEHASVAAFERLAAELVAVDAPVALVEWAGRAAIEEVGHARMCFRVASAYEGKDLSAAAQHNVMSLVEVAPRWAPSRRKAIERLAVESLVDGCVEEGLAARVAELGAVHAKDRVVAEVLRQIAREERSHAELAHAVMEWALEVEPVVRRVVDIARDRMGRVRAVEENAGDLLSFGRVSTAKTRELRNEVVAVVKLRQFGGHIARDVVNIAHEVIDDVA